jgi:hypothetical protein
VHIPTLPPMLHAWQAPPHALLQHTPSAQVSPVLQSVVSEQVCPCERLSPH